MLRAITVVIPTHDRRETLLLALGSVLDQTRKPVQVLVVADGCTDGTVEAVRAVADPRVEVLELPKGPGYGYGHRNEALRRARGDVVSWLCDDDLYLPEHLERVGELFDAGLAELVCTPACLVDEHERLHATWMDWGIPFYRERFLEDENRTPSSAVSHTLSAALSVGGWRTELPRAADMDLWQRMLRGGARAATTSAPTVLHFRAAGRDQPFPERVRQNRRFAERSRDPVQRISLRAEMNRAMHQRVAEFEQSAYVADQSARAARKVAENAQQAANEAISQAQANARQSHAEAELALRALEAVHSGAWQRLQRRLLPALALARRVAGKRYGLRR
jgi:glycosyltransferase involved in cell wall biosynthesis